MINSDLSTQSFSPTSLPVQNSLDWKRKYHPLILRWLEECHQLTEQQQIDDLLSWDLMSLPSFSQLKDLARASDILIDAIHTQKNIGIYGDYDVDGTTSCALFYRFFQMLHVPVQLIQPSRFIEGYGLHLSSIDLALEKKIDVLVTVDCGITSTQAADYAKEKGLTLIITDHHADAGEKMIEADAVVNPNRRDEPIDSPLRALAGVGVAFAVCWQIKIDLEQKFQQKIPSLYSLLQYVAIGTICDLAKLNSTNLRLVRHGLKQLPKTLYPGLKVFLTQEERVLPVLPADKLGFHIGPMINSKGRLDHPERALNLLITDKSEQAILEFSHLESTNQQRKIIQAEVVKQAKEQILKRHLIKQLDLETFFMNDDMYSAGPLLHIVYSPDWHEGVIGIVASRIVETFKVPAIVFTNAEEEGLVKASARSAGELNLFDCLKQCEHLFKKFGGHKAAAGLSMPKENLRSFIILMNEILKDIPEILRVKHVQADLDIQAEDITPDFVRQLEACGPFGMGYQRPLFKITKLQLESYKILKEVHVSWQFSALKDPKKKFKGISFSYMQSIGHIHPEEVYRHQLGSSSRSEGLSILANLAINRFRGQEFIQFEVVEIQ